MGCYGGHVAQSLPVFVCLRTFEFCKAPEMVLRRYDLV